MLWTVMMRVNYKVGEQASMHICIIVLLGGLLVLNLYWTFLFFKMGHRFIKKGEAKDLQNPVEDIDKVKKTKNQNFPKNKT